MSASDHLNESQFPRMAVSQLKRLWSVEGGKVSDHLDRKLQDVAETEDYAGGHWDSVRKALHNGTIDPVHVQTRAGVDLGNSQRYVMGEGHHRVALADQMGISSLPVSRRQSDANDHGNGSKWRSDRHFGVEP